MVSSSNQVDTNGNGVGDVCEVDFDNDGIGITTDNCPNNGLISNVDFSDSDTFVVVGGSGPYFSTLFFMIVSAT